MLHVVDPCYHAKAVEAGLARHMNFDEAVAAVKSMGKQSIDRLANKVLPAVSRYDFVQRIKVYGTYRPS